LESVKRTAAAESAKDRRIRELEARLEALEVMIMTVSGTDQGDMR
jgi:hypothetical protein